MNRTKVLVAAAVVAPVLGLMAWAFIEADTSDPDPPPKVLGPTVQPVERAASACRVVEQVQNFVAENEDPDVVFDYLEVAGRELDLAAAKEPIWISLQSGITSLDRGLHNDDAAATELGIAIARDQCRRANIYLPGSVRPEDPATPAPSASPQVTATR